MPFDFGLNIPWRSVATPPFVPEEDDRRFSRMPSAQPPPPPLSSLDDMTTPVVPSAASKELQTLIQERMAQKPASMKRQVLGTIVGGWLPSIGQEIASPGTRKFTQKYNLLNEQAKLEGEDFDRRLKAEDIRDKDWNRRYLRYQAGLESDRKAEEAALKDSTSRSNAGEQILTPEPFSLPGMTFSAPAQQREVWPEGSGPPALQPLDAADPQSITPVAKLPGLSGISKPTVPQGYYQVPRTSYDPKDALRVKPTQGQLAKEKAEAGQVGWLEVTPEMAKALPNAGVRAGQKVPPSTWESLVKEANPNTKLEFKSDTNEVTGDMTIAAFNPLTGEKVTETVLVGAGKKRPAASTTITIPQGDTEENIRRAGDRVLSGEITVQQAHGLLGGQRGGLGGKLLQYIESRDSRIVPPKIREGINNVNMGLNQLDQLEQMIDEVVAAPTPEERAKRTLLLEGYADTITARLARANGEVGVLTDQDVARAKSLLAGWKAANFAPDYAKRELAALRQSYNAVKNAYQGQYFGEVSATGRGNSPAPAQRKAEGGYEIGVKYGGLEYLGGPINDAASWKK